MALGKFPCRLFSFRSSVCEPMVSGLPPDSRRNDVWGIQYGFLDLSSAWNRRNNFLNDCNSHRIDEILMSEQEQQVLTMSMEKVFVIVIVTLILFGI